jgi:hypothetical protein
VAKRNSSPIRLTPYERWRLKAEHKAHKPLGFKYVFNDADCRLMKQLAEAGFSQEDVGTIVGCSQMSVSRYLRGEVTPTQATPLG